MIVLFVITNQIKNGGGGAWGFGDILKGLIHVHQLSKKYNFQLYVDFQHHPLSNYFRPIEHPYKQHVHDNIHNIHILNGAEVENYIITNSNYPIIQFFTNEMYRENVTQECKEFIKSILIPNDSLQSHIHNKFNLIPYSSYNIIHYRVGDHEMQHGVPGHTTEVYHGWMLNIHLSKKENSLLISDSGYFKEYVKKHTHIFAFNDKPSHIGSSNDLQDSLVDFFIVSKATEITSYSIYDWPSGFTNIPAVVYDVPISACKI